MICMIYHQNSWIIMTVDGDKQFSTKQNGKGRTLVAWMVLVKVEQI